jgi:hypothetical protein
VTFWGWIFGRTWVDSSGLIRNGTPRPAMVWLMEELGRRVLQSRDGSWKIGRVDLEGQRRTTQTHHGRPPAMLALGPDGVYFYDGPERGVRKLTFDLEREAAVAAKVICSPLVVSSRVICAHVGGLFDIPGSNMAPRFLASERAGPITVTAATADRAYWVAENGNGRLIVRSVALAGL